MPYPCAPFTGAAAAAPSGQTYCANVFGNNGRNSLVGPGLFDLDFSVFKNNYIRRISESFNVQFRAEMFNVFNHAEWRPMFGGGGAAGGDTNNVFGNPGFLQVTSTHLPRILQLGAKLLF